MDGGDYVRVVEAHGNHEPSHPIIKCAPCSRPRCLSLKGIIFLSDKHLEGLPLRYGGHKLYGVFPGDAFYLDSQELVVCNKLPRIDVSWQLGWAPRSWFHNQAVPAHPLSYISLVENVSFTRRHLIQELVPGKHALDRVKKGGSGNSGHQPSTVSLLIHSGAVHHEQGVAGHLLPHGSNRLPDVIYIACVSPHMLQYPLNRYSNVLSV
uniref:Uncharacterized protein n=1 Tax=Riboviria sp. TaxID=2585031 RepID=A0A8K1U2U9_9VIRU|nr:MAG: hypothetical protein 2 [Riboviria sp.]